MDASCDTIAIAVKGKTARSSRGSGSIYLYSYRIQGVPRIKHYRTVLSDRTEKAVCKRLYATPCISLVHTKHAVLQIHTPEGNLELQDRKNENSNDVVPLSIRL